MPLYTLRPLSATPKGVTIGNSADGDVSANDALNVRHVVSEYRVGSVIGAYLEVGAGSVAYIYRVRYTASVSHVVSGQNARSA